MPRVFSGLFFLKEKKKTLLNLQNIGTHYLHIKQTETRIQVKRFRRPKFCLIASVQIIKEELAIKKRLNVFSS